jgi:Est1 DNA/RNA binding domain/Telomerase activating protein Est1
VFDHQGEEEENCLRPDNRFRVDSERSHWISSKELVRFKTPRTPPNLLQATMMSPSQDSHSSGNYFDPAFLEEKLNSIQHLESDLENSHGKDQQLRIRLCELYSGCLLRNPAFSYKHNVLDRLWRNCFYQRIADERKEISRRKRKNAGSVPQATATFHKFLEEAIDLYRYLVKFYVSLVSPENMSVDGSQSYDLSQDDLDEDGKGAVVAILHRFEIYLGDLHRYGDKYQDAACHYEGAAMLAPGQGNPYNQLAVLEQLKDSSCNALYWYARSIRASIKPFETSLANVERLYQSNRKWLMDNSKGLAELPAQKVTGESVRTRKSVASKRFAANFVDMQLRLRAMVDPNADGHLPRTMFLESMASVISDLESFLSNNGLSDTLLCRMVVINAFSVSQYEEPMAKVLVLQFGTSLAQRVEHSINKILDATPENSSAIRGMSSLLLTCDHVSHFESQDDDFMAAERTFWSKLCDIANKIAMLIDAFRLNDADVNGKLPREYNDLIGFTPFETFIAKPKDFLSIEDAKEVIALYDSDVSLKKMSQESTRNPLDIRIKLARLLAIVETSAKVTKGSDGYHFSGAQDPIQYDEEDEDEAPTSFDEPSIHEMDDPASSLLVYKLPERGGGPALLVPGAILAGMAAKNTTKNTDPKLGSSTPPIDVKNSAKGTGNISLMPLAHTAPALRDTEGVTPAIPSFVVQDASPAPPPPGLQLPPGLRPPPGFAAPTHDAAISFPSTRNAQPAWDFASLQPTSNPFVQPVTMYPPVVVDTSEDFNSFLNHDESAGFLDAALLQSLWLDDAHQPLSKNPFIAGAK